MEASDPIRVVIVDDQRLVRDGLAELIGHELEVCGLAANGREAIELCQQNRVDVALVDVVMPVLDGPGCTRALLREQLVGAVLALTTYDTDDHLVAMLAAGAAGYVLKDIDPAELIQTLAPAALRRVLERFGRVPRTLPTGRDALTPRELDVLRLVARGLSNVEISERMALSESTVKSHIGRLLDKLTCRDRSQLVVLAYECGVVRPGDSVT
jgi:DNA-binding NarL/FixJ family response regulator